MSTGIRHHFVRANGLDVHVAECGAGRPVLFLHGFPEWWYCWRHVMTALAPDFRAIAIDTRGIGETSGPADVEGYRMKHLVADTLGVIDALALDRPILAGHDWGGFIAWTTAIRHPERLSKLVIVNAAHPGIFADLQRTDTEQQAASRYMLAFRSPRGEELVSRNDFGGFRDNILAPGLAAGHLDADDVAAYEAAWRRPGAITAGLNYYRANKSGPPSGDDAPPVTIADTVVRVPTLVLWGERDPYFAPANVSRMPEGVADLRLERFARNDHWIIHQRPREIAASIRAFAG